MKAAKFKYIRPSSLDEAINLLSDFGEEARILAGGQSLLPTLNMRLSQPKVLIDINRLDELQGISHEGKHIRIGALTRHVDIAESDLIIENIPLISEAIEYVAHVAVRNRGTFGGSVALADPAAEMPACTLALQGTLVVEGPNGRRQIRADDFFHDLYETARAPEEILVEVQLPIRRSGESFAFMELSRRKGDYAMAGLACKATFQDNRFLSVRLVYFGTELKPTLGENVMSQLEGREWSETLAEKVIASLEDDLDPVDNLQGSAAMKLHLQKVLTKRTLAEVVQRLGNV